MIPNITLIFAIYAILRLLWLIAERTCLAEFVAV